LGIIEGFYGKPWGFEKREALIPFMCEYDYSFYLYAPKADVYLREKWQEAIPEPLFEKLKKLGESYQANGIGWGVGLSPYGLHEKELHESFEEEGKQQLLDKLKQIEAIGCDYLAILFDDMRGDFPELAQTQTDICHFVKANSSFESLIMCPSYYSFDPVLEKVFGEMPKNYWQELGEQLDADIEIFWTGEKVCSEAYPVEHLSKVEEVFQRKVLLWDNYPVNDGARMSPFLHLSKVAGREQCTQAHASGIAINPMNEAFLSQVPMAGLSDSIFQKLESPSQSEIFEANSREFLGLAADAFIEDRVLFEEKGLNALSNEEKIQLGEKYLALRDASNQHLIDELLAYLKGDYLFDLKENQVPTQSLWE
jgi:hypothetical protein